MKQGNRTKGWLNIQKEGTVVNWTTNSNFQKPIQALRTSEEEGK